jgi:hypothetical protein
VAVLRSCQGWMWESGPRGHPADHSLRNKTQTNITFDILMSVVINMAVLWALRACNVVHKVVQVVYWLMCTAPLNLSTFHVTEHDVAWWVKWAHTAMSIQCSRVNEQTEPPISSSSSSSSSNNNNNTADRPDIIIKKRKHVNW